MFFKPIHALSVTLHAQGARWVWTCAQPGQPPVTQGVWEQVEKGEAAWPSGTAMRVALPDTVAICQHVSVTPGLSWRDRRFQQALALLEAHPALGDDAVCDVDASGQVCGLPQAVLQHWQHMAETLGCRLQWLGLARTLKGLEGLEGRTLETLRWQGELQHLGPNWAASGRMLWWRDQRLHFKRLARLWQRRARMTRATVIACLACGAMGICAFLFGLAALGDARDEMTRTEASLLELHSQRQQLQQTQAELQKSLATQTRTQSALQPLQASGQATAQWLEVLMQARGVGFTALELEPVGEHTLRWRVQGEALTPAHVLRLRNALAHLSVWQSPPTEINAHWQHGEPGRFSVWVFELQAELTRPW
jgi:hypothetical protein